MINSEIVYEDRWGEIIDRAASDLIEVRWFDATAEMSKSQFQDWLEIFADHVGRLRRSRILIDGTNFKMNPAFMDGEWRDANIIPRYNAAGVENFAFHMPPDMPLIQNAPAREGPGVFPTGYFGTREDAMRWLRSSSRQ